MEAKVITGNAINVFRLKTLISGAKLEASGMRLTRGRSCLAILKTELGCKGSRAGVVRFAEEKLAELQTCEDCSESYRNCECGTDPSEY